MNESGSRHGKQLTFFLVLAVVVFIGLFYLRIPDNVYSARTFLLDLLVRIASFLVPVVLATTSVMINRYTGAFFNLILKDDHVIALLVNYIFYFLFHLIVISITPLPLEGSISKEYLEGNYSIFLVDTIFAIWIIVYSVFTSFHVFFYTQPDKLSDAFINKIRRSIQYLNKYLFDVVPNRVLINQEIENTKTLIGTFTNLTVNAIKAKDYETIKANVKNIGEIIWGLILEQLRFDTKQEEKLRKQIENDFIGYKGHISDEQKSIFESITDKNISEMIRYSRITVRIADEQIGKVYKDIFESGFSSKEFFACDEIITHLQQISLKNKELSLSMVFEILKDLFEIAVSFKYHGYTRQYCQKIIDKIQVIYVVKLFKKEPIKNYDIYISLLRICIINKEPDLIRLVLESFKGVFLDRADKKVRDFNYKMIADLGIYCLKIKSMGCLAVLIRFFVTSGFNLQELDKTFANQVLRKLKEDISDINSDDGLEELLDDEVDEFDPLDLFESDNGQLYLRLKFYVIWFSYLQLQIRISPDRVEPQYHSIDIDNSIKNKVNFTHIRTILLDLETHIKSWDKLYVTQSQFYFVEVAFKLLMNTEWNYVEKEIEIYGETELLKKLKEKIS